MSQTSVTPNSMPGAETVVEATETEPVVDEPQEVSPEKGLSPDKLAELNRTLRNEKKAAERTARESKQRADQADQRWQQLAALFGADTDGKDDFDAKAAVEKLTADLQSERTERLRADVARETSVDPEDIQGSTEEAMRASAERFLVKLQKRIDEALAQAKTTPAAPPASTVTSNGKISGPQQITSPEELNRMSPTAVMAAYKEGRLDQLQGKKST